MALQRKNATKHSSPTASQLEGHNVSESSSSEVEINNIIEEHPPRTTRSQKVRAILQSTPPQSEEESSSSGSGEESGSQSHDGSEGNAESASGLQEEATTPPPAVTTKAKTGAHEEAGFVGENEEITTNDTMVQYFHIYEYDLVARQQLIYCFHSMCTVDRCDDFFNNGIVMTCCFQLHRQVYAVAQVT
uniref:Uncharacterized protein n=1 Tax=Solanum tuberosum TaxID=4113 RepID=M1DEG4_SOLTU